MATDSNSQVSPFKIHRFILTPIISVYDEYGEMIGELQGKPITAFVAKNEYLKDAARKAEQHAYEKTRVGGFQGSKSDSG